MNSSHVCTDSVSGHTAPMRLVLDTNVVLDWLVFDDESLQPLRVSLETGRVLVLTHPVFIAELRSVLGYAKLRLDAQRQERILQTYLSSCCSLESCDLTLPNGFPRCRDPDDEPFLALGFAATGSTLVSRDRQVLRLRKRAQRFGLQILDVSQLRLELSQS